jgi:hypothetical protein
LGFGGLVMVVSSKFGQGGEADLWNLSLAVGALLGMAVVVLAIGVFGALLAHYLFAARIHPREWKRRASAIFRFFLGERASGGS